MSAKFFNEKETEGLSQEVVHKLDRARDFYGSPIIITSGYRTPERNAEIGGVPESAHTKGLAVDIRAPLDPFMRIKLAWALGSAGFRRLEIAKLHYHVDCDDISKPSPVVWEGKDF